MFSRPTRNRIRLCFTSVLLLASVTAAYGAGKHSKKANAKPQDGIDLIAHLPLRTADPVTRFIETKHSSSEYLYVQYDGGKQMMLIDVTVPERPRTLAETDLPEESPETVVTATGSAVVLETSHAANTDDPATGQTIRIMSFADPHHPTVKHEFKDVTAVTEDKDRGLMFLANNDGLWTLRRTSAQSREDEELRKSIERTIFNTP